MSTLVKTLTALLVGAIVTEVLLLRILARAGIYMFKDGAAAPAKAAYLALLFVGESAFNLAAVVAALLLGVLAFRLVTSSRGSSRLAGAALAWPLGIAVLTYFRGPAPFWSAALLLTTFLATTAVAIALWTRVPATGRWALGLFWAASASALFGKLLPQAAMLGFPAVDAAEEVMTASELLFLMAPAALVPAAGQFSRKAAVAALTAAALSLAPGLAGAPMLPLILTWAFGVTVSLPYFAYVAAAGLSAYVVVSLASKGRWGLLAALGLLLLGHRGLSLTYFDLLLLDGMVILGLELVRAAPRRREAFVFGPAPAALRIHEHVSTGG